MDASVAKTDSDENAWGGGADKKPMGAPYGKMMMWFFLTSDSLTFAAFILGYGLSRFKLLNVWPVADDVFDEIPFFPDFDAPLYYTAFMTFILIFSSVTMVLAVDAGRKLDRKKVTFFLGLTILGGLMFIGSQAYEWTGFIQGENGAIETKGGRIMQVYTKDGDALELADYAKNIKQDRVTHSANRGAWYTSEKDLPTYSLAEVKAGFEDNDNLVLRTQEKDDDGKKIFLSRDESLNVMDNQAQQVVEGANLTHNEYGHPLFADFFFFVTGFHGFHVSVGITLLIITFINVLVGTYEKRKSYLMVEKIGLYWHFVDLVWVFVFTFFYLV